MIITITVVQKGKLRWNDDGFACNDCPLIDWQGSWREVVVVAAEECDELECALANILLLDWESWSR